MTLDDLHALADEYFEWPDGNTQTVTLTSALLFAKHVLEIHKKSLRTRNNAGMDALRKAAQQALEALDSKHDMAKAERRILQYRAFTALRAALEQEQDPELAAALGWPGGISDPVLDRKTLLQQVARLAQERAHGIEEET